MVPLLTVPLVAGPIGGVVGFASAVILLSVRAYVFGAAEAVPILTVAALSHRLLGAFILRMIPACRWAAHHKMTVRRWRLVPLGAIMGLMSGIVGTVGPINAPCFLAYGLVKQVCSATEALGAAATHLTKSAV